MELAAQCAFTPTDMTTVLNSILGSVGSAGLVRRTAQNFEPFVQYLPEKVWKLLLDPDFVQDYRVDVLHAWLRTMGLRNPTEGTIKLINSFCLSLAERWDALVTMNTSTKTVFFTNIMTTWGRASRSAPPPAEYIEKLP